MKRYGMIGTCYNMGISHIASGFAEHLHMKTLLVDYKPFAKFPQRFKYHRLTNNITQEDLDWLLKDIDVLFTIETPYAWDVYKQAKAKGIKTILMPMIEWLDRRRPELKYVDLFVCPSSYTYETLKDIASDRRVEVPCEVPVDLKKFKQKKLTQARVFLHNSGHGGLMGRNSTRELIQAIPYIKSDIRLIIRSQMPIQGKIEDARVTYLEGNVENYWDLYEEGDVWIMPVKYGVALVGLQECLAAGMLPCVTDMEPFNGFIPKDLLIEPQKLSKKVIYQGQQEPWADHNPQLIAQKIDELAMMDIRPLSQWAELQAKLMSWDTWKSKYEAIFNS